MKFRGDYIQECVCTELIQNAGYNRGWHSMAMLTYLKKNKIHFSVASGNTVSAVPFIIKMAAVGIYLFYLPVTK